MTLKKWLRKRGWPKKRGEVSALSRKAKVARQTIYRHLGGKPIGTAATANRISRATGYEVSAEELCGWV